MANEIITVIEYITSSPLFIGVVAIFGIVFLLALVFIIKTFCSIGKSHKQMRNRFNRW